MKKILTIILITILVILIGGFAFMYNFGMNAYDLLKTVDQAMLNSDAVEVTENEDQNWIIFTPTEVEPEALFVYYPGARVPTNAYAPLLHEIAAQGIQIVTPYMPLNFAIFGQKEASDVFEAYPDFEINIVGGHSLGGAMAQFYVFDNQDTVDSLILLGSYGTEGSSLAESDIAVFSIYGSQESGALEMEASDVLYPQDAQFYVIEGGNHAQFGDYGLQSGDGIAEISRAEQQAIAAQQISEFILSLGE